MSTKRLSTSETDDQPREKRTRHTSSFASVIREVMMVKSFQVLFNSLEPLIRRVVKEEVERGVQRNMRVISRSPSLRLESPKPTTLRLIFTNKTLPTTFTCNPILDVNNDPLQLMLVEQMGNQTTPKILAFPLKIELVAIDGDFPTSRDNNPWSADEFNRKIIKEREGRRPLLSKDVNYVMKNTSYVTVGNLGFTDNSSWLRSRKFRVGARLIEGSSNGVRVIEALTEAFVVKDQRGESYRKHYPPTLDDNVWRLEKIGKDGKFHKRLGHAGVFTVQDFLKLSIIDPVKLKTVLGGRSGLSEKTWESILRHAKTCEIGDKLYVSHGTNYTLILDAICQIVSLNFHAQQSHHLNNTSLQHDVDQLVKNAYDSWSSLEVVKRLPTDDVLQEPQGIMTDGCSNPNLMDYEIVFGRLIEVDHPQQVMESTVQIDWEASPNIFD